MSDKNREAGGLEKVFWGAGGVLAFIGGFIHVAQSGGMTQVVSARGISPIVLIIWVPGIALLGIAWLLKKGRGG
jgi:lipopolysaccharide export LptBFGC system permease protein LptF